MFGVSMFNTGVATLKMNRKPVNSLNQGFLTDLVITLEKLENEKSCRGLILTSVSVSTTLSTTRFYFFQSL